MRDKLTWIAATSLLNANYLHIIKAVCCFIFFLLARLFKKFDTMHCCFIYSGISIIVNNDCSWFISCQFFTVSQLYTLWDAVQGEMLLEAAQKFKKCRTCNSNLFCRRNQVLFLKVLMLWPERIYLNILKQNREISEHYSPVMIQKLVARGFLSEALNTKWMFFFLMTLKQCGNAISVIISSFEYQSITFASLSNMFRSKYWETGNFKAYISFNFVKQWLNVS